VCYTPIFKELPMTSKKESYRCGECAGTGILQIKHGTARCPKCGGSGDIINYPLIDKSSDDNKDNPMDKVAEDLHGRP
jgi:RecJ-like exonuclease